jgi:hypothetical protein
MTEEKNGHGSHGLKTGAIISREKSVKCVAKKEERPQL